MRTFLRSTVVTGFIALMLLAVSAPAQAASYPSYKNKKTGQCLEGQARDTWSVSAYTCDGNSAQDWEVESRPQKGTKNDVVKLRNVKYNRCMDSKAGKDDSVFYNVSCNTGDYQLWEVFYNSNGTRTFKSWGAWTKQGLHLCLSDNPKSTIYAPLLKTCNRNSALQQWSKV
ncbi:ricin-type beta-trefoil lectin domain protein [Kineosporia sp. J2-2]|uniref:Ricin-type beta-trefoil lectin domain protein n=1 Tax=Kineosporia corallincola TaxID=2835133 RepID=A0ABS5TI04_9ACTN|nr:ricin-type beta-trefoil lectin domain protein [Kineosporia corallincola]MBT0770024.1 ricin-type beta-trefoil lectin domain protein [Kineosporia corallincola]